MFAQLAPGRYQHTAHVEESFTSLGILPRETHWTPEKPGVFDSPGALMRCLSLRLRKPCSRVRRQPKPAEQRGAAPPSVACSLLTCYHLSGVALPPARGHPSLGREPIRFYKPSRVRLGENVNGNAQNNKGSLRFPSEDGVSQATCCQSPGTQSVTSTDPPK